MAAITGNRPENERAPAPAELVRWHARRRWARAGLVYTVMLAFAVLFLGPLLLAFVSSLRVDPLSYPPTLNPPQLWPRNWVAAANLGAAGADDAWFGGFAPGASVSFEVTYLVADGNEFESPEATIPRRRPAGLGATRRIVYAADHASLSAPVLVESRPADPEAGDAGSAGTLLTYRLEVRYPNDGPTVAKLPLDVTAVAGMRYESSTLSASRLERRGRVASFDNIVPGALGYVFHNYRRVFDEVRAPGSEERLFLLWFRNTFVFAFWRIVVTLAIASLAGYALARLRFAGKELIFVLVLFAQMIPDQLLFISNYLVLRDGIWGLSRLWGQATLLNSMTGLVFVTALNAAGVFIMKQFFETIPREVEEAAMIDGASQWGRFWRVVLPMGRPALGALTILTFQGAWNDFFWPLIVLTSPETQKTLPVGLLSFRNTYGGAVGDWGLILSGAVLSAVPVIVLFVVFQRYFLEGVAVGGTKG
ncbi:MAG: carbohydrate ABC transporter permease [Trueperaceae bacterium]